MLFVEIRFIFVDFCLATKINRNFVVGSQAQQNFPCIFVVTNKSEKNQQKTLVNKFEKIMKNSKIFDCD
jgi:hypothetical protein